jgi:hypothetical protein
MVPEDMRRENIPNLWVFYVPARADRPFGRPDPDAREKFRTFFWRL